MSRERNHAGTVNGNKESPLVSVIIPAYNAEAYIAEAVDSVLEQDYPNKEVIVIDDGSIDDTVDVLVHYGERIRLLRQTNAGSAVARNKGMAAATGGYIAFLDGDDVWLPGKLTAQVAYMERHSDVDMTQGRWTEWRQATDGSFPHPGELAALAPADPDNPPPAVPELSGWVYHLLLTEFMVWTSVVMVRRRLIERVGTFDNRFVRGQDFQYWLRASRHTQIHKLDRVMALYRQHRDNSTRGCPPRNYAAEIIDEAVRHWGYEDIDGARADARQVRHHCARLWAGFAYKQLRAGQARRAARSLVRAISLRPLAARPWLLLIYSLLGAAGLVSGGGNFGESAS